MAELAEFQRRQLEFTAHIRNPSRQPGPADVEDRRMQIYRDLLYNNVAGFIENGFPVLRRLYDDEPWERMVRDFFANHRCRTPYFLEIAQEFLTYLAEEREPRPEDPPFLSELAHYEWVELALSVDPSTDDLSGVDPNGDLLEAAPVLSSVAWLLAYSYPVHRIGPEFRPDSPSEQPHYLLVYRDRREDIQFVELNPVTARLIDLIRSEPGRSGRDLLGQIAEELGYGDPDPVVRGGAEALAGLREGGVILGTRRPEPA
jgi:hypothetical protein